MAMRALARLISHVSGFGCSAFNLVFPPSCAFCTVEVSSHQTGPELCVDCLRKTFTPLRSACSRCGAYGVVQQAGRCSECRNKQLYFDAVHSLGEYEGRLQSAVLRMKYQHGESLGTAVGQRLADWLDHAGLDDRPDLVTCVPKRSEERRVRKECRSRWSPYH